MRILIAEDEASIARALKVMLEKNKYTVDMVHNGADALEHMCSASSAGTCSVLVFSATFSISVTLSLSSR